MVSYSPIIDMDGRDAVKARIEATAAKNIFRASGASAKWLRPSEHALGIDGGFANMVIMSPAGARSDDDNDRILFYNANGVLVHEAHASEERSWFMDQSSRAKAR